MRITGGSVFDLEHGFCEKDLCTDGSVFAGTSSDGEIVDASGCYVIPGLVDVHFHGCVGEDFSDATPEGLQAMADYELSEGVAYICPAGMTLGEDQLSLISLKLIRYTFLSFTSSSFGAFKRCQEMASPSRSGSVAR